MALSHKASAGRGTERGQAAAGSSTRASSRLYAFGRAVPEQAAGRGAEQLVDAIHVVARGEALLSPSITRRVIEQFVSRPPDSMRKPPAAIEELTSRELEMLRYLARGLSNAEIAKQAFVSETTVKS